MIIPEKLSIVLKTIRKAIKWLLGFIFAFVAIKKISEIGRPKKYENWKPVPGHKGKVEILNPKGKNEIVKLPKDPDNGKQIKNNEILAVGIGKTKGVKNVQINRNTTNTSNSNTTNDSIRD